MIIWIIWFFYLNYESIHCAFAERERERERVNAAAEIFSYKNLLKCYYDCRRRKRYTVNALKFELHFEHELLKLQKELVSRTYKPGQSICFVVTKPKHREIFAADFRDRIVHHVLVGYLEPIFEAKFIDQSYACRKGKGAHKTIEDLERYLEMSTKGKTQRAWYLQADTQSFFVSLKKHILFEQLKKQVNNPKILWLAETIIFHNPTTDIDGNDDDQLNGNNGPLTQTALAEWKGTRLPTSSDFFGYCGYKDGGSNYESTTGTYTADKTYGDYGGQVGRTGEFLDLANSGSYEWLSEQHHQYNARIAGNYACSYFFNSSVYNGNRFRAVFRP